MTNGRTRTAGRLLASAGLLLGCWFLASRSNDAGSPDGVDLAVDTRPGTQEVALEWTGGQPVFEIFRSPSPEDMAVTLNKIGETDGRTWVDIPPVGDLFFYFIKSPCVVDPPERCDGIDNDCDGSIDEDYIPSPTTCGVGECDGNTGQLECIGGIEVDTCDPSQGAMPEADLVVCDDGLDNDCDGSVDCADTDCAFAPVCGGSGCGDPPYDCDGNGSCECPQACDCPNQCFFTIHDNGLGQTWQDCEPFGAHNATQAAMAANAWGRGAPFSAKCEFRMDSESVVCVDDLAIGGYCACWAYTDVGSVYSGAGYVRLSPEACRCPIDPTCSGSSVDACFPWD